ncbi:MAG TPA: SxtJ family membrane protein [Planctomycetaceae bacterium]|nr:SxtJ family membrane protein [Planctomycetaceae bacterium]
MRNDKVMAVMSINWKPSARELRWFAGLLMVFFTGVAGAWWWKSGQMTGPVWMTSVAVVVGLLGLAMPLAMRWVYLVWMIAVWPIGWVVSHLLLALIFFGIITPIGVILRALGRDPMHKTLDRSVTTYWIARPAEKPDPQRYFQQF